MDDLTLERLARLPSFYHPAASPDGSTVAYYYDGTSRNELYVQDRETGDRRQVSDGEVPRNARWPFRWRPDGEVVYFHRDEGGDEQNDIYELTLEGDLEPVVTLDGQCVLLDVAADGRLYVASDAGEQLNLYVHEDGETRQLTHYDHAVGAAVASPDGERLAFTVNETDDRHNEDVYVADAEAKDPHNLELGEVGSETTVAGWFPDGERLLVGDNTADVDHCGVYDLEAEEVTWYGGEHVEEPVTTLADGERFLALRTRDAAVVPVVYDVDGEDEGAELALPEGVASAPRYGDTALLAEDELLVAHESPGRRKGLYAYDLADNERTTLLEPTYGEFDPTDFAEAEYVTFESHDGLEIGGVLYDAGGRPSPAVVKVHGGPPAQDQLDFDRYAQFLALEGYTVLEVNYRGSTGRGREFERMLDMDWGGAEQGDVAAGARWLADREWIDDDRIAVFGGSYGGYSAYMQLLQYPELYESGVAWIGVTDLHAMYEESMPHYRTELLERYMGDPEENYDLWRDRSPIEHVENLDAPLLIVHGVNDARVPISQARLFREALEDAGYEAGPEGDFEYEELGEEGHGSTDTRQQLRAFRLVADFLDRRL